jgi:Carboxypeptidase regulatory-like domain
MDSRGRDRNLRARQAGNALRRLLRTRPALALGVVAIAALTPAASTALRSDSSSQAVLRAQGPGRATQGAPVAMAKPTAVKAVKSELKKPVVRAKPTELHLHKAHGAVFDVRTLKSTVVKKERPEHPAPGEAGEGRELPTDPGASLPAVINPSAISAPAPGPDSNFAGLDFANWGQGHPPDTNGDVGPTYYIETINVSMGIYDKSSGNRVAAFTFNSFMSQGNFGNLCDTDNFGDPVVVYDSFEDRWVITDFAFKLDASGNVNPQTVFQCFAVSKTGDPVTGGWNYYSILAPGGLADYPKFGVWSDGLYMSANMFGYSSSGSYFGYHVWAINKAQMYAGAPTVQVVDFAGDTSDFTVIPANARLQAGSPPAGSSEYFVSTEQFLNALSIYKFHVDWDKVSTSTFTGPFTQLQPNCWPNASPANASTPANAADTLAIRAMAQAQYTNIGGAESLWVDHTVQRNVSATNTNCNATTGGNATIRWYQANVTGGNVAANVVQGQSFDPEAANTFFRFMPSLAVDRLGDMAIGYTKSNSTTNPQIKYAGRLAGDPANTLGQSEQTLIDGTGAQSGNCGPSACTRWGDYSGMALDPNGCEFWMTGEYYAVTGLNHQTRIGSFHYPGCTPVGNGTLSGTVTDGTNPISGATVALGNRTTTTNGSGAYSFAVPAGTYASLTASKSGFDPGSASTITVPNGGTATRNFTLNASAQSGCFTDNSQSTFQRGVPTNCDLVANPGSVVLANPDNTDAKNNSVSPTGFGISNTAWAGQTFTPSVSGQLKRVDVELFCASCTAPSPNITVSIQATTGSPPVPTGGDLATATIPGFNDGGVGGLKTATFASPVTLTAGTRYAFVFRLASAFASGTVAYTCSCVTTGFSNSNPYATGQRVTSANSGASWTADTTVGGRDLNFITYINPGFATSGTFISSLKDANPAAGRTPTWTTLSFTASTPASTAVKFQVAASNSSSGPFNYVGPDGTAGTFFTTSGAGLSQFNGLRYLRYKAFMSTSNGAVTPSLSSVTVCFVDTANSTTTALAVNPSTGTFGGTTALSATLTAASVGVSGATIAFTLNGNSVGSAITNGNGVATLGNVSLAGINAGSYPAAVGASFAGDGSHDPSSGSSSLIVGKADQAITVNTHAPANAVYNTSFSVAASGGGSGNPVTFSSSGACSNTGNTFTMTSGTGTCSVRYDQAGNGNYNPAPQVIESVNSQKAGQTITVNTHAPASAVYNTSFSVAASGGGSGNPVAFSSSGACTNAAALFTMNSGTGTCTVQYNQVGDANYSPAPQVTESVNAQKANQTITVSTHAPANAAYNTSFGVQANAPGGVVSFSSSGACSNSGNTFTMTSGTGNCNVNYNQGGDSNYNPAPQVTETVNAQKANQTINVTTHAPASASFNQQFTVAATGGGSGNPVTFSSSGACTNNGATFTITSGTGTCTVNYDQAGDANYNAALQVIEAVSIGKIDQAINVTIHAPASAAYNTQFTVAATGGGSGNPVTFSSSGACTNTGAAFTMTSGTGTCSVQYDQAGDSNYNPAPQVTETVNAQKAGQTITVSTHAPAGAVYNTSFGVAASAPGGVVTFSSSGTCSNAGNTFTMNSGTGTCTVQYDQAGNSNYNPAPQVTETVNAQKAGQTITVFTHAPAGAVYNTSFGVQANAPGGVVSFSSSGACSNTGNTFTMTSGTGTCSAKYDQAGNSNYNPAPQVTESVNAQKADQTITFNAIADKTDGDPDFDPGATASSGLAVAYSASGSCSIVSGKVHITGPGSCMVDASQGGDSNYNAATPVSQTFSIVSPAVGVVGVVGLVSTSLGGAGAIVDSFDSGVGPYGSANKGSAANVLSNGPITLNGAKVNGNVRSTQGSVTLGSLSLVTGNVAAGTTISNSGTINGTATPNAPSAAIVAPAVAVCSPFSGTSGIGGQFKYAAATGNLTVGSGKTATLANGSYCFHDVTLSRGSVLRVAGPVAITVTGKLSAKGAFDNRTFVPANLQISSSYTGNSGVGLVGGNSAYLTVYAPGTSVVLSDGGPVFGSLLGKTLTVSSDSDVHVDSTGGSVLGSALRSVAGRRPVQRGWPLTVRRSTSR